MLIEFTVGNYKSIRQKQNFSFVAAEIEDASPEDIANIFKVDDHLNLLTCAAVGSGSVTTDV